jgi:hypothetical protein
MLGNQATGDKFQYHNRQTAQEHHEIWNRTTCKTAHRQLLRDIAGRSRCGATPMLGHNIAAQMVSQGRKEISILFAIQC